MERKKPFTYNKVVHQIRLFVGKYEPFYYWNILDYLKILYIDTFQKELPKKLRNLTTTPKDVLKLFESEGYSLELVLYEYENMLIENQKNKGYISSLSEKYKHMLYKERKIPEKLKFFKHYSLSSQH
jgi:hypothetical protein